MDSLKKGVDTGLFRVEINLEFISRMYFSGMNGIRDITVFPDALLINTIFLKAISNTIYVLLLLAKASTY
jgi:hypothetical protein